MPDDDYPLIFITVRQLEHRHTDSITRHSATLEGGPRIAIKSKIFDLLPENRHCINR